MTYRDAVTKALQDSMRDERRLIVIGQNLANHALKPLADLYGAERIRDCSISESAMVGLAVGAAMKGMKVVVMIAYAALVTFPLMGRDYEAAVTTSGLSLGTHIISAVYIGDGVFGILAYSVQQQVRDFGVRRALVAHVVHLRRSQASPNRERACRDVASDRRAQGSAGPAPRPACRAASRG